MLDIMMSYCSDEVKEIHGWKGLGFFVLFSKWYSLIQLPPFIYFTLIVNTSYVPMTAKSKQKNIPGKLKDIIYGLEGRMNGLLNCLDTDM